jgi:hypothetical protein
MSPTSAATRMTMGIRMMLVAPVAPFYRRFGAAAIRAMR